MKNKFMQCGILGWCLEILWTGFLSFRRRDLHLKSSTSIWMFPIYGMASLMLPLCGRLKKFPAIIRGSIYTLGIFTIEFLSGSWLKKRNLCPWDYSKAKYNLKGVIRLDYAPLWFITGLALERRLNQNNKKQGTL
ncbi:MAG: hypothetical protein HFI75_04555 [Lachnospiraceae bacterium]|nr:hypothetical protein [Lachnospiraceae bacterium]